MRATLLNTDSYVGSEDFLSQLVWLKTGNQSDLMSASDSNAPHASDRASCAIVGTVSPVRLFLEPHGNFNPMFENSALETSKVQFQLTSPETHQEFSNDFKIGIEKIESLQNKAIVEGSSAEHFVVLDGQRKALKFSWPLFEKRVRHLFIWSLLLKKNLLITENCICVLRRASPSTVSHITSSLGFSLPDHV